MCLDRLKAQSAELDMPDSNSRICDKLARVAEAIRHLRFRLTVTGNTVGTRNPGPCVCVQGRS